MYQNDRSEKKIPKKQLSNTTPLSFSFQSRCEKLHQIKLKYSKMKQQLEANDGDDWGQIPFGKTFVFIPESDRSDGLAMGVASCGKNFRNFLEQCPVFVCKQSSLLGGYYFIFRDYVIVWDPENFWTDLAPALKKYNTLSGLGNRHHFGMDLKIGLDLGFGGLLKKIQKFKKLNPSTEKFYTAHENTVRGIQAWIKNHIVAASEILEKEKSPEIRQNLSEMIDGNRKLIENPPETFREACQWIAWYQMAARMYNGSGALGSIDQLLYPYYKKDLKEGRLSNEEAIFHLACLNFSDPQYVQIGGVNEKGKYVSNELSFLILEAAHCLQIPANIALAVHNKMNRKLLRRAIRLLFQDKLGTPRFFSVENMVKGYQKNNVPLKTARQRTQIGCHWFNLPGREYSFSDVIKINFAKILNVAFYEMMLMQEKNWSSKNLWKLFKTHLNNAVKTAADDIELHMKHHHEYYPELVLNLLCYGPIEKGQDASFPGCLEYNTICVDGAGLATAADSFAAIEHKVEKEKKISWKRLLFCLNKNFDFYEHDRQILWNSPSYGRENTAGEKWAERISKTFTKKIKKNAKERTFDIIPGLFSWSSVIPMGNATEATPNGRHSGSPLSFGANPDPGKFKGGEVTPTSMALAIAKIQPGYGNTAPMQIDLDTGWSNCEEQEKNFEALLLGHFNLGGTLVNVNIFDKKKILEAYSDPSKHPDLIVRVTGFSAYFASLSEDFRKLICNRILYSKPV